MTASVGKKHRFASWIGTGALAVPVVVGGWIILAKRNSLSAPGPAEVTPARAVPATGPADEPDEQTLRLRAEREEARRLEEEQAARAEQEEVAQKKEAFVRKVPGTAAVKGTGRTKVSSVSAAPPPPAGIFLAPAPSTPSTPAPGEGPGARIYTSEDATAATPTPAPPKPPARRQR